MFGFRRGALGSPLGMAARHSPGKPASVLRCHSLSNDWSSKLEAGEKNCSNTRKKMEGFVQREKITIRRHVEERGVSMRKDSEVVKNGPRLTRLHISAQSGNRGILVQ